MPQIHLRSDLEDRCICGHTRGEHLTPTGSDQTQQCLIVECHCPRFDLAEPEGELAKHATQV